MALARSKLTARGQISVPAQVRNKLGIGPGSILEWDERNDEVIIRRAGKYSSAQIHAAIFAGNDPSPRSAKVMKDGIRDLLRKKYARG